MDIHYRTTQLTEDGPEARSSVKTCGLGELLFASKLNLIHGYFPPRSILNEILSDTAIVDVNNLMYEWEPFELTEIEYEQLRNDVLNNPEWETRIDDSYEDDEEDWELWAFEQRVNSKST